MKTAFIGVLVPKTEDGGKSVICELSDDRQMFVRLHSHYEGKGDIHPELSKLIGKRVIITIEVID